MRNLTSSLAVCQFLILGSAATGQSFRWIAAPGFDESGQIVAVGLSHDGRVAAGNFVGEIWRWTAAAGTQFPADLTGSVHAISPNGQTLVGQSGPSAFLWRPGVGQIHLGQWDSSTQTIAYGTSNDTIVGSARGPNAQAFRWTAAGGFQGLGIEGDAFDISANGSVIVGASLNRAFRWTESGVEFIADDAVALAVSPDGSLVAGHQQIEQRFEAFLWADGEGLADLELPVDTFSSQANDVSNNGVIVGYSLSSLGVEAFRWTAETGFWTVRSLLGQWGIETGLLHQAVGVSADGRWIVGNGLGPTNKGAVWLAEIPLAPPPRHLPGDYNGNGVVEQGDLDYVLLHWGAETTPVGWIGYPLVGRVDQEELDHVLLNWGKVRPLTVATVPEPRTARLLLAACCLCGMYWFSCTTIACRR